MSRAFGALLVLLGVGSVVLGALAS